MKEEIKKKIEEKVLTPSNSNMEQHFVIKLPSSTITAKYEITVKSLTEEVLFNHTFYGNSKPLEQQSVNNKIKRTEGYCEGYNDAKEFYEKQSVNSELANEVLKVWNEDGDNGEIQMKTPIAWYRVIRKAEAILSPSQNQQNEKESDAVEKVFQIDFDGDFFARIKLHGKKIKILAAMNRYGTTFDLKDIHITEL